MMLGNYIFLDLCILKHMCNFVGSNFNEYEIIPPIPFGFQLFSLRYLWNFQPFVENDSSLPYAQDPIMDQIISVCCIL
jgi:hypothetical protein